MALAGPPNVGKSSLLNALSQDRIWRLSSDEPGTTRDVREVALDLGGRLVILVDMAGLRETDSRAEAEGVRRAEAEIARADLVLWLVAPDVDRARRRRRQSPIWTVGTKSDLGAGRGRIRASRPRPAWALPNCSPPLRPVRGRGGGIGRAGAA